MNYESEIREVVVKALSEQYGLDNEWTLYHYFALRFFVSRMGVSAAKERVAKEMVRFLWDELNLPFGQEFFVYKGEMIQKGVSLENSLENMVESWKFEASIRTVVDDRNQTLDLEDYLSAQQRKIKRIANNKSKPYKGMPEYEWHWFHHALHWLNTAYNLTPRQPERIPHVLYPDTHLYWKRTLEEVAASHVHASGMQRRDVVTISEKDVEDYLISHLELIEEGLTYISRQVVIPEGRIDILVRDCVGVLTIIEVKVEEDKDLVWQCMYYAHQIKKQYHVDSVRVITIAPSYSQSMMIPLRQLPYVEPLMFVPLVCSGEIKSLTMIRASYTDNVEKCL